MQPRIRVTGKGTARVVVAAATWRNARPWSPTTGNPCRRAAPCCWWQTTAFTRTWAAATSRAPSTFWYVIFGSPELSCGLPVYAKLSKALTTLPLSLSVLVAKLKTSVVSLSCYLHARLVLWPVGIRSSNWCDLVTEVQSGTVELRKCGAD